MIETFAKRMKTARLQHDIKQKDLAERIGVRSATISAYENENESKRATPSLENAFAIAKELNVSLDYLCGLEAERSYSDYEIAYAFFNMLTQRYIESKDMEKNLFAAQSSLMYLQRICEKYEQAINKSNDVFYEFEDLIFSSAVQTTANKMVGMMEVKEDA